MTNQEVFTTVKNHLLTQNARSNDPLNPMLGCQYRSPTGLKCAAGCLIPDEDYKKEMEGRLCWSLNFFTESFKENMELLNRLQKIHDKFEPIDWPNLLQTLAEEFNLVY